MNSAIPLVSILINNYNYGRFLQEAIESALHQTYPNTEVIVVDDGSTDNSGDIIASYGSRVIPVLKGNGGQASSFNAGFLASQGEWVLLLDADDLFARNKAEAIIRYAAEFPAAGLIAHSLDYCDGDGAPATFPRQPISSLRLVDDRARARRGKLSVPLPPTSALALRRDVLADILPMPEDIVITADNFLKFAGLGICQVLLIPDCLATQRIHLRNFYTRAVQTEESRLHQSLVNARIAYHMHERFPQFGRLNAKMYGRAMQQLFSSRAAEAKSIRRQVRQQYDFLRLAPFYWFYVVGAFVRSFLDRPVRLDEV